MEQKIKIFHTYKRMIYTREVLDWMKIMADYHCSCGYRGDRSVDEDFNVLVADCETQLQSVALNKFTGRYDVTMFDINEKLQSHPQSTRDYMRQALVKAKGEHHTRLKSRVTQAEAKIQAHTFFVKQLELELEKAQTRYNSFSVE